ncbi:MAG TPA: RHS repeat protein, partial [Desulfobacterales bacterium]|nr:RHS repeat protein [Desulfobacterales bacterium]
TSQQYIYDDPNDPHNLTGIVDENSTRILTVVYDDQDQVISSAFADGARQVSIDYQADMQRVITNSLGISTTYQLEASNGIALVTSFVGPGCSSCGEDSSSSYTYNDRLQILSKTNGRGIITRYTYDNRGNRTEKTEAEGTPEERITTWIYEADSSRIATAVKKSVVDPAQDSITAYTYDSNGNISTLMKTGRVSGGSTESVTTTYTYDTMGRIETIDGPRTDVVDVTTFTYYANEPGQGLNRGMLQQITNSLSHETLFAGYNEFGKPETITNANGTVTQNIYNAAGLLSSSITAGITTGYEYYPNRQIYRITAPDSRIITYTYTSAGYLENITDSQGNYLALFYNTEGKKTREEVRDPGDNLTAFLRYTYEDSGRLDKIINQDDTFTDYNYDETGNLISLVNAVNQNTSYEYDSLDRLTQITQPNTSITGYGYDSHGNITTVTDPENHATGNTYDDFGHRLNRNSPDTGTTQYIYDSAGNIVSSIDANGVETTSEYDTLNRLTATRYPDSVNDIQYSYDQGTYGIGHLTGMTSTGGIYAYSYDATGYLLSENTQISGQSYLTEYTYNQSGQVTGITYPTGRVVAYTYDNIGHVTLISNTFNGSTTTIADNISYLPHGPLKHLEYGNTISYDAVFDQQYRMTGQTAGGVLNRTYTQNALGNVTTITDNLDTGNNQGFTYDDLSRIDSETGNYGSRTYSHDKTGNRLSLIQSGTTTTYSYEATSNKLTQVDNNSRSYDLAGMTTGSENGKYQYSYNEGNRLESLSEKNGTMFFIIPIKDEGGQVTGTVVNFLSKYNKTHYLYDGFGRRTESLLSSGNSGTYHYHYNQSGKLLGLTFYDGNGTHLSSKEFIWLDNLPVAQVDTIFTSSGAIESSNIIWLHTDHLNTPLFATNAVGNVVWRWDRDAFGTTEPDTDPDGDGVFVDIPLRFPGQVKMSGDGNLYYNMYRFYESGVGRYLTPDPIGLDGGINLFSYVLNDPVNWIDPWGLARIG